MIFINVGVTFFLFLLLNWSLHLLTDNDDLLEEKNVSLSLSRKPAGVVRYLERVLDTPEKGK